MGNARGYFRPDRQLSFPFIKREHGRASFIIELDLTTPQKQTLKKEHTRRQRQHNKKMIEEGVDDG